MARTSSSGSPSPGTGAAQQAAQDFVNAHKDDVTDEVYGIADLAERFDVTARAIRFYETKGLLAPKRVGNTRIYSKRERVRLQLILRGKALGLTLDEIKEYLDLYGEHGEGRQKQLELVVERTGTLIDELEDKRAQLDKTLAELKLIRATSEKRLRRLKRGGA